MLVNSFIVRTLQISLRFYASVLGTSCSYQFMKRRHVSFSAFPQMNPLVEEEICSIAYTEIAIYGACIRALQGRFAALYARGWRAWMNGGERSLVRYGGHDMAGAVGEPLAWRDAGNFMKRVASGRTEAYRVFCSVPCIRSFEDEPLYLQVVSW